MFRFTIRDVLWLTVVVATAANAGQVYRCPRWGGAMIAGVKLGGAVYSCPGCGQTFERAGG